MKNVNFKIKSAGTVSNVVKRKKFYHSIKIIGINVKIVSLPTKIVHRLENQYYHTILSNKKTISLFQARIF